MEKIQNAKSILETDFQKSFQHLDLWVKSYIHFKIRYPIFNICIYFNYIAIFILRKANIDLHQKYIDMVYFNQEN